MASRLRVSNRGVAGPAHTTPSNAGGPFGFDVNQQGHILFSAIGGFAVTHDGTLGLISTTSLGAGGHPLDEAVSRDQHLLYVLVDGLRAYWCTRSLRERP